MLRVEHVEDAGECRICEAMVGCDVVVGNMRTVRPARCRSSSDILPSGGILAATLHFFSFLACKEKNGEDSENFRGKPLRAGVPVGK